MSRFLLVLCLGLGSGLAYAADPQSDTDTPEQECPRVTAKAAGAARTNGQPTTARPDATPASHARTGGGGAAHVVSPRWHSLLPGMFR